MKTRTYARLALLIPFLLWGLCLLLLALMSRFLPDDLTSNASTLPGIAGLVLVFYVFGILFWFVPYLLLSLFLLICSFRSRIEVLMYIFLLSPFIMAILMMIEATLLSVSNPETSLPSPDLISTFQSTMEFNAVVAIIALVSGYLCVGLGFGIYKLLQHKEVIKKDANPEAGLAVATTFE